MHLAQAPLKARPEASSLSSLYSDSAVSCMPCCISKAWAKSSAARYCMSAVALASSSACRHWTQSSRQLAARADASPASMCCTTCSAQRQQARGAFANRAASDLNTLSQAADAGCAAGLLSTKAALALLLTVPWGFLDAVGCCFVPAAATVLDRAIIRIINSNADILGRAESILRCLVWSRLGGKATRVATDALVICSSCSTYSVN